MNKTPYKACLLIIFIFTILQSCSKESNLITAPWQEIRGRDNGPNTERVVIYRAKAPSNWIAVDSQTNSITDTTLPIGEWHIKENSDQIRITLHNFPTDQLSQRIAPIAQVERWQQQFDSLDPVQTTISPSSHGGFAGLYIEATGTLKGEPQSLLGWSMQLATQHYQQLSLTDSPAEKQRRADYTIKVLGPPDLMQKHRKAIIAFSNSFELIEEIPTP